MSDAAAASLAKSEAELRLNGLTELSDAAAASLAKSEAELRLNGLMELSDAAAASLAKYNGFWLELNGLKTLSAAAARSLSTNDLKFNLRLNGLEFLCIEAKENLMERMNLEFPVNDVSVLNK